MDDFDIDLSQFELRPSNFNHEASYPSYYDRHSPSPPPSDPDDWLPKSTTGRRNPLPMRWSPPPERRHMSPGPPPMRERPPSPVDDVSNRMIDAMMAPPSPPRPLRQAPPSSGFQREQPRMLTHSPSPLLHQNPPASRERPPSPTDSISDKFTNIMLSPGSPPRPRRQQDSSFYHTEPRPRKRSLSPPRQQRRHALSGDHHAMDNWPSPEQRHPGAPQRHHSPPTTNPKDYNLPVGYDSHAPSYRAFPRPPTPPKKSSPSKDQGDDVPPEGFHPDRHWGDHQKSSSNSDVVTSPQPANNIRSILKKTQKMEPAYSSRERSQSQYTRNKSHEEVKNFQFPGPNIPVTPMPDYEGDAQVTYIPQPDYYIPPPDY